jgi:hypothetical protein
MSDEQLQTKAWEVLAYQPVIDRASGRRVEQHTF